MSCMPIVVICGQGLFLQAAADVHADVAGMYAAAGSSCPVHWGAVLALTLCFGMPRNKLLRYVVSLGLYSHAQAGVQGWAASYAVQSFPVKRYGSTRDTVGSMWG
jgi:hypothetical protein